VLALAALGLAARRAPAQQPRPTPQQRALIAATEDRLWTARLENGRTFLSYRDCAGQPIAADPLNARVVALAAAGQQAYMFQEDGSCYRYDDEWAPALDLPGRTIPIDLAALDDVPYALVHSDVAAKLPAYEAAGSAPTSRLPVTTSAPLTLVRYDHLGWSTLAPCPPEVGADAPQELRPRLCGTRGRLMLFSRAPRADRLDCWTFEAASGRWFPGPPAPGTPGLRGFWPAVVNRLPTLVLDVAGGDHKLRIFRLVSEDAGRAWEAARLDFSPLPAAAHGTPSPVDACGFNQHLGLQVQLPDGSTYLRFGRFEGPATLGTIDLLAKPPQNVLPALVQALRATVMLGILVALFVFRRGSLVTPFPLARGLAPAFVLQRLAATMVDLLPFTALAALVLQLSWGRALDEVARLVSDSQAASGLPSAHIWSWMLLSAGAYAAYCAIMELLAGRTLGKMLVGLHVVSEQGGKAPAWRVIVRNLFRTVEVLPPFWILAFVVLLSRNRQRVGDIFARTVVVRQVAVQPDSKQE
jgi:uncharacterized RDD family membrane protein YckC